MNITRITELLKNKDIEVDDFVRSAKRYIKASKDDRIMCVIYSVSRSGMSRQLRFVEQPKNYVYNFYLLFDALGFSKVADSDNFRISGCGMDMVFATNYSIIHQLCSLGFITKKTCRVLAQNTPTVL